jgi:hypothetical protein
MTAHELAKKLLEGPDVDVVHTNHDSTGKYGNDYFLVTEADFYEEGEYATWFGKPEFNGPHITLS